MSEYIPQIAKIDKEKSVFVRKTNITFELVYFSRDGNNSINYLTYSLSPVQDGDPLPILSYLREINLSEEQYSSLSLDPSNYTFNLDNLYGGDKNVLFVNKLLYKTQEGTHVLGSGYTKLSVTEESFENKTVIRTIFKDVYVQSLTSADGEDLFSIPLATINMYALLEVKRASYSSMSSSQFFNQLKNKLNNITISPYKNITAEYYYREQNGGNAQDLTSSVSESVAVNVTLTKTSNNYNRITIQEGTQMLHTTWYEGKGYNSYSESNKLDQTKLNQFITEVYQTINDNINTSYTTSNIKKIFYTSTGNNMCHSSCHSSCHDNCHDSSSGGLRMNR